MNDVINTRPPEAEAFGGPVPFISLVLFALGGLVVGVIMTTLSNLFESDLPGWAPHAVSHASMGVM
ncbi:MAG: hypothetical protein ABIS18_03945, partial [Actinomycetota bacterium]